MIQAVWIEIPVKNIERAARFYKDLFNIPASPIQSDEVRRNTTLVNSTEGGTPGISLTQVANFEPGDKGPLVYLSGGEDLNDVLNRVESAGGQVVEHKTSMGEAGSYGTFRDTEGNLLALYSYP